MTRRCSRARPCELCWSFEKRRAFLLTLSNRDGLAGSEVMRSRLALSEKPSSRTFAYFLFFVNEYNTCQSFSLDYSARRAATAA